MKNPTNSINHQLPSMFGNMIIQLSRGNLGKPNWSELGMSFIALLMEVFAMMDVEYFKTKTSSKFWIEVWLQFFPRQTQIWILVVPNLQLNWISAVLRCASIYRGFWNAHLTFLLFPSKGDYPFIWTCFGVRIVCGREEGEGVLVCKTISYQMLLKADRIRQNAE